VAALPWLRYALPMNTLTSTFLRRLPLDMLSAKAGMSPQHLSKIESCKRGCQ
jgi:hypothetical protein